MKNFSLIVPTRGRISSLNQYLQSVDMTVKFKERITVIIVYDNDDKATKDFLPNIVNKYKFKVKCCERPRTNFINKDYYNFGGEQCDDNTDYFFINADDVRFVVMEWDTIVESKIEMFCNGKPDRIVGIGVKDNTPKPKPSLPQFPCFPLVTKEAFKHFGFILHPFLPTWGADVLMYILYSGINRYLPIDDKVYMHHIGVHTKTGPKDETAQHVERVFNALKGNPKHNVDWHWQNTLPKQIQEFRNYLSKLNKG